jgi:hypothetical protein
LHVSLFTASLSLRFFGEFFFFFFRDLDLEGLGWRHVSKVMNEEAVSFVLAFPRNVSINLCRSRVSFVAYNIGMGMFEVIISCEVLPSMHGDLLVGEVSEI